MKKYEEVSERYPGLKERSKKHDVSKGLLKRPSNRSERQATSCTPVTEMSFRCSWRRRQQPTWTSVGALDHRDAVLSSLFSLKYF